MGGSLSTGGKQANKSKMVCFIVLHKIHVTIQTSMGPGLFFFFFFLVFIYLGLPWWLRWQRISPPCRRPRFDPWVRKSPWRREWQFTPAFLLTEFLEQKSLVGYNPRWSALLHFIESM